jgi:hypothetical protein
MGVKYVNRKGETYYLLASKKPGGRPYFSRKSEGTPLEALPAGNEIHESPETAQVFLRKIKPTAILPLERQLVISAIRSQAGLKHFIVQAEGREMVVYLSDIDPDQRIELLGAMFPFLSAQAESFREDMVRNAHYVKMMRFVLVNEEPRLFTVERWCFLGSIDTWYTLPGLAPLAELVDRYAKHLGKESFFELM